MLIVAHNGFVLHEGVDASSGRDFFMADGKPVLMRTACAFDIVQAFDIELDIHKKWIVRPSEKMRKRWEENNNCKGNWGDRLFERKLGRISMQSGEAILEEIE